MRRLSPPFSGPEALVHTRSLADFITTTSGCRFSVHTGPVVIYSMTTSAPEDAPHGMEFLYSLNRLNVAISRAQCIAVIVASPALFQVECKTPRQIQLANA